MSPTAGASVEPSGVAPGWRRGFDPGDDPVLSALQRYREAAGSTFHPLSEALTAWDGRSWNCTGFQAVQNMSFIVFQ